MASIRKTKKILKNSKGIPTIILKHSDCALLLNKSIYITSSKFCAITNDCMTNTAYIAIPYRDIKRVYINK